MARDDELVNKRQRKKKAGISYERMTRFWRQLRADCLKRMQEPPSSVIHFHGHRLPLWMDGQ